MLTMLILQGPYIPTPPRPRHCSAWWSVLVYSRQLQSSKISVISSKLLCHYCPVLFDFTLFVIHWLPSCYYCEWYCATIKPANASYWIFLAKKWSTCTLKSPYISTFCMYTHILFIQKNISADFVSASLAFWKNWWIKMVLSIKI